MKQKGLFDEEDRLRVLSKNEQIKNGKIPEQWQEKQNKAKLSQKDCDARWTKKHKRSYYGYKDHIKVDKKVSLY